MSILYINISHISGWSLGTTDKNLRYRVSIFYAKPVDDDGVFTCTTPQELTNHIAIRVTGKNLVSYW